jgi:hypothetical protein
LAPGFTRFFARLAENHPQPALSLIFFGDSMTASIVFAICLHVALQESPDISPATYLRNVCNG